MKVKVCNEWNVLSLEEVYVIENKGIECFFIGEYNNWKVDGVFVCWCCEVFFYDFNDKFNFGCGWFSFDDDLFGIVCCVFDVDGCCIEIVCDNCGGYLGYVFEGECMIVKNIWYCVNFLFIKFVKCENVE